MDEMLGSYFEPTGLSPQQLAAMLPQMGMPANIPGQVPPGPHPMMPGASFGPIAPPPMPPPGPGMGMASGVPDMRAPRPVPPMPGSSGIAPTGGGIGETLVNNLANSWNPQAAAAAPAPPVPMPSVPAPMPSAPQGDRPPTGLRPPGGYQPPVPFPPSTPVHKIPEMLAPMLASAGVDPRMLPKASGVSSPGDSMNPTSRGIGGEAARDSAAASSLPPTAAPASGTAPGATASKNPFEGIRMPTAPSPQHVSTPPPPRANPIGQSQMLAMLQMLGMGQRPETAIPTLASTIGR